MVPTMNEVQELTDELLELLDVSLGADQAWPEIRARLRALAGTRDQGESSDVQEECKRRAGGDWHAAKRIARALARGDDDEAANSLRGVAHQIAGMASKEST